MNFDKFHLHTPECWCHPILIFGDEETGFGIWFHQCGIPDGAFIPAELFSEAITEFFSMGRKGQIHYTFTFEDKGNKGNE